MDIVMHRVTRISMRPIQELEIDNGDDPATPFWVQEIVFTHYNGERATVKCFCESMPEINAEGMKDLILNGEA